MILALLTGCADVPVSSPSPDSVVHLSEAENYSLALSLDIPATPVRAHADTSVDWSGLTHDLAGSLVDPMEVFEVSLFRFHSMTAAEVGSRLLSNQLLTSDVAMTATWWNTTRAVACDLSDLVVGEGRFDPELDLAPGAGSWLLRLRNGQNRDLAWLAIEPTEGLAVAPVDVDDRSAFLVATADLQTATPIRVDRGEVPEVEWSAVRTDSGGGEIDPSAVQTLLIVHYESADVSAIEVEILELGKWADAVWTLDVYGSRSAHLADASDGPALFTGFDTTGVWMVGLGCSTCQVGVPLFLGQVDVR